MWHLFAPSLHFLLFLHMKCSFGQTDCQWRAVVNTYSNLGGPGLIFYNQTHIASVMEAFTHLTDSAVDADDKNAHYYGFPYFLKVDLVCIIENSERAIRMAHYTGLSPTVTVAFQQPVHAVLQKQERLHIELLTAAYRYEGCDSEEVCKMSWFIPMPLMNGSAVMDVQVTSDSLGLMVDDKRFAINVNGFTAVNEKNEVVFKIGTKLSNLKNFLSMKHPSRPLWYTYKQAPVLILGGVPDSKVVIISDSEFENFFPIEVGIDSCWIGSLSCPQIRFSSSIVDAIATESTLFIRQNQLVYYFTGSYQTLYMTKPGSELWTRILNNVCVKKLCPVLFEGNETEYVIAIAGGWEEGHFYIISTKDGEVTVSKSIKGTSPDGKEQTVCEFLKVSWCSILWADFAIQDNVIIFLVNYSAHADYTVSVVVYMPGKKTFQELYKLPKFVPADSDNGLVMLLGIERYSNIPMVARGLSLNPYSHVVYIWGNIILQSKDLANYLYFSNFPSRAFIKYFVISFQGQFACVTDNEEVWVSIEGGSAVKLVYPTQAWDVFTTLRVMSGHRDYAYPHGLVSIFFDKDGLNELVYIERPDGTELLTKREFPLGKILTYDQIIGLPYRKITYEGANHVKFSQMCPIADLRLVNLPAPQFFTRIEHYSTKPPEVMDKTMFHNEHALHVFQGLIYQLLWLHSDYNRPYADPVHDPTWRWWKDKKQDSEYYTYLASNRNSSGGVFVDMNSYLKIYHLEPRNSLPKLIYLDKQAVFSFGVYLSIRTAKQSMGDSQNTLTSVWLTVVLAHPEYLSADLQREELISRGGVLYTVSIKDTGAYPFQALSGKNLQKTSFAIKVVRSGMNCYHYTGKGPELKGSNFVAVRIGCPPGKRLAFDITGTLELVTRMNKRYFDCVKTDPEMPCFFFSDVFYPLFLIQDMVTGDSGPFNGSYILKVIGGGPHKEENIRYFNDSEIQLYNAANESDISNLIWVRATEGEGKDGNLKDQVDKEGFQILSRNQSGIQWVCQKNSPCYGITPQGLRAPEYFFVIKVTNRGVDQTTYCDYALEFIIHVHGLRLSPKLAIFILQHSVVTAISFVVLYILIYILGPKVAELFSRLTRRIEEAFASRIESSLTFSSSYTSQGSLQNVPSSTSETHSQKTAKGIV